MLKVDSFCLLDDSMKTLRFVAHWSASVRQGFVGAFVVGSLFWVMQPANAHGDVRGTADDGLSISELRLLYAMGIPHRLGGIPH